jgi:hypothetical protein
MAELVQPRSERETAGAGQAVQGDLPRGSCRSPGMAALPREPGMFGARANVMRRGAVAQRRAETITRATADSE